MGENVCLSSSGKLSLILNHGDINNDLFGTLLAGFIYVADHRVDNWFCLGCGILIL